MAENETLWLLYNPKSGSNDPGMIDAIERSLADAGLPVAGRIEFPEQDLPDRGTLDRNGVTILAIFAGDGTINSAVKRLDGWTGTVLPLPGGTKNLLVNRLHGEGDACEIAARLGRGEGRRVNPGIVESRLGTALAGVVTGPGAAWSDVREAMRDHDVAEIVTAAAHAIGEATAGPRVHCVQPACGSEEGYQAIVLGPGSEAIEVNGYGADTVGEYAEQGFAILKREFRSGPHEFLGAHRAVSLRSSDGEPMGILIDGEPCEDAGALETFEYTCSRVAMLATVDEVNAVAAGDED